VRDTSCLETRRTLDEYGVVTGEARAHLESCPRCRAHAALLCVLDRVPSREADAQAVARIMTALPPAPWQRRRVATWLPLAAGVGLVASGFALLGGMPAQGAVAQLPGVAGGGLAWLGSAVLDAVAAARGSSDAVRLALAAEGLWVVVWAALTALGGGWAVRALARGVAGGRE